MKRLFSASLCCLLVLQLIAPAIASAETVAPPIPITTATILGEQNADGTYKSATLQLDVDPNGAADVRTGWGPQADSLTWKLYKASDMPTFTADGTYTVYYASLYPADPEYVVEPTKSITFTVRRPIPTTTATILGEQNADGTYRSAKLVLSVDWNGAAGPFVTAYAYSVEGSGGVRYDAANPPMFTESGTYTIYFRSYFGDPPVYEEPKSITFTVRAPAPPAPVTTATVMGEKNTDGTYKFAYVEFAVDANGTMGPLVTEWSTDGGATWSRYDSSQPWVTGPRFGASGTYGVLYRTRLEFGGIGVDEAPKSVTLTVSYDLPTTTAILGGTAGDNGWYRSPVTVSLSVAVGSFPAADTEYSVDGGATYLPFVAPFTVEAQGESTILFRTSDFVGRTEATKSVTFRIDTEAPALSGLTPGDGVEFVLGSEGGTFAWQCADEVSGVAEDSGAVVKGAPVDTSVVGAHSYTVTAADAAGNSASRTVTYFVRYAYSGLQSPVNADGSSVFNLGSTVPLKFDIADGAGEPRSGVTATIGLAKVSDGIAGTEFEAVSNTQATWGNTAVESGTGRYAFNLGTKGLEVGTYEVRIVLDDGSTHTTRISLR